MKIVKFEEKYTDEMVRLYQNEYSEDETHKWSYEKAKESLETCWNYFPDYSFVALDEAGICMGGIFNLVNPYFQSDVLFVISIQVKPEYRGKGVAKGLLKKAIEVAGEKKITGVRLLTDVRKEFPKSWYEKIGLKRSGYIEYAAEIDGLDL
ncbi:MAG: GNAT family N-acetyltransferase [Candidatus Levybacteria bacterium]|nr:GNAT family N-acetyltransferase [Candidatus Levybacteria bacterium]